MARVPVLSRLPLCLAFTRKSLKTSHGYVALFLSLALLLFESVVRSLTLLLPKSVIRWFRTKSEKIWHTYVSKPTSRTFTTILQSSTSFTDMCAAFGYEAEEHVVQTKDGYLLCLHRICRKKGEPYATGRSNLRDKVDQKPVVYLHHGLFMNSEVWICQIDENLNLPFRLVEAGYDVWFGNNRGNKYSKKSLHHTTSKPEFWNFSMDEFAFYDIPDSIDYVLHATTAKSLSYIGFSQGTAQAFAALSIYPQLNEKVNVFIALAPAMSPKGLSNPIVDAFIKASPTVLFLLFGRKALLTSTIMWQSIIYPPIFVRMIDISCGILFGWTAHNIPFQQRIVSYAHLYSYTSVKALVHWFQIIRAQTFQMFDDEVSGNTFGNPSAFYKVAKFPTKNIRSPIILVYGTIDSLVDIDVMLAQLPPHTIAKKVENYEHLDILWGKDVDKVVIPHVLEYLKKYADPVEGAKYNGINSINSTHPSEHSITEGPRKRGKLTQTEPSLSYTKPVSNELPRHSQFHDPSYAQVVAGSRSDSDETMSDEHDVLVNPVLSFADCSK